MKIDQGTQLFLLIDSNRKSLACMAINACPEEEGELYEVILRKHEKRRSLAQQALMWIWHGQWEEHFGDSRKEEHIRFKAEYLLPVLLENPDIMPGIEWLYRCAQEKFMETGDREPIQAFYKMISTTWLKVRQFSKILTDYQQDASTQGLAFNTITHHYDEAMGARR